MPDSRRPGPRFSDADTQEVLRRADRRQVEQIAADLGIGPAALRRALAEVEADASDPGPAGFLTGRLARAAFDVPLGRAPGENVLPQLAAILEAALGAEGEVEMSPTALLWRLPGQHREIRVSVRPRPGGAAIRVEESLRRLGAALFGGIVGGVGGGLGGPTAAWAAISLGAPAVAGPIAVGALGTTYWWAKRQFVREVRRRRLQLALIAHVLADALDTPE